MEQTFKNAQANMREAYFNGAPGLLASGLAWLASAAVAWHVSDKSGVLALLGLGMLIFPLSLLIGKLLGRSGAHDKSNPLGALALETTFWMLICLPLAYIVSLYRIDWFYPAMMFIIGGRYLIFSTLYGLKTYWLCAIALIAAATCVVLLQNAQHLKPFTAAAIGGGIELLFAARLFITRKSV